MIKNYTKKRNILRNNVPRSLSKGVILEMRDTRIERIISYFGHSPRPKVHIYNGPRSLKPTTTHG